MAPAKNDELRRLMHALREPLGAFVIRLSLLDESNLDDDARKHVDAMAAEVQRMTSALVEITKKLGLEAGDSTPLSIVSRQH